MSIVLNMVGGGGGSLKNTNAVLLVTVPTGSSVTATKGAITLTPTIWTTNADNTLDCALFYIKASTFDANAWTVTATLNGDTASDTVVINAADEYDLDLDYGFYLYKNGTQGVSFVSKTGSSVTFESTYIRQYYSYNGSSKYATVSTTGTVNLANYSTLWIEVYPVQLRTSNSLVNVGVSTTAPTSTSTTWNTASKSFLADLSVGVTSRFSVDISNSMGSCYIGSTANTWGTGTGTMDIHITKIWLK